MSEYTEAVESSLRAYSHVTPGILEGCKECPAFDEGHYSARPCDACGTELAGDRYAAHGRDSADEIVHFDICVDCLFYLEYGVEPADWPA